MLSPLSCKITNFFEFWMISSKEKKKAMYFPEEINHLETLLKGKWILITSVFNCHLDEQFLQLEKCPSENSTFVQHRWLGLGLALWKT